MSEQVMWAILGILLTFGWIGLGILQEQIAIRNRMRLREMLHRERMAALEKGLELPDTDVDDLLQESFAAVESGGHAPPGDRDRALRRAALGAGLVLLLGGIGWYVGMSSIPATPEMLGMQEMAGVGVIPAMVGVGLLIFWLVLGREAR